MNWQLLVCSGSVATNGCGYEMQGISTRPYQPRISKIVVTSTTTDKTFVFYTRC